MADQLGPPELTFRKGVQATWPMLLAAVVVGALLSAGVWWLTEDRLGAVRQPTRLTINLPPGITADATIESGFRPLLAISPDGRWLVFAATDGDTRRLFKRSLEEFDAVPIRGTEGGFHPFISPDGDWVGFFADEKLKKIPLNGGPPQVLADAPNPWGATWGPDGTIVFNPGAAQGLWRISSTGGAPEKLCSFEIERGDFDLAWPEFLPDGDAVLFTCFTGLNADTGRVEVLDLKSRTRKTLVEDASYARYVPTGHLVFGRRGHAEVAPFDVARREITGPSVPVPESVFYEMEVGALNLGFSADGTLAFIPGGGIQTRQLVSVDLMGVERPLVDTWRGFMYPTFSPDGQRLAVTISEPGDTNIWVIDLATGAQTRLTREGVNAFPSWTPDGERVTYLSSRGGYDFSIDWKRADGSGENEPLISTTEKGEVLGPGSWSPDGKTLVYFRYLPSQPENGYDTWVAPRDDDREPRPFDATRATEWGAVVSPDGKWLAYTSGELGRAEIYVQPFPDGGERYQISTDGGDNPVWSPDGRSIYYRADERRILAAPVTTKPRFRAGPPTVLLNGPYETGTYVWRPDFDIAPDGKSFVVIKSDEKWGKATEIRVVFNWFDELKRLAPTK